MPGLLQSEGGTPQILQATQSACAPFLGITWTGENRIPAEAKGCIDFNDSVVDYLRETESVKTVILSSTFASAYFYNRRELLKKDYINGNYFKVTAGYDEAYAGLKRTVDTLRSLGKKVVAVGPPPSIGIDPGLCLERLESGLVVLGVEDKCQIDDIYRKRLRKPLIDFLEGFPDQAGLEVILLSDFLCSSGLCQTFMDGKFLYRDQGHLSYEGSVLLGNNMGLLEKIKERAK